MRTERLLLREWREADRDPWAALNADPAVREFFPSVLTREQSDEAFDRISGQLADRGWGLWAVDLDGQFLGFTGLAQPDFRPEREIGWRFAASAWGHGYATEAALAVLHHAFTVLDLPEVVSFTTVANTRSRAVMERIGMVHDPDGDFEHPAIEPGHPQRRHVLYRIRRPGDATPAEVRA
jgi:RimJ/RimL family protein N-acetyltransferase